MLSKKEEKRSFSNGPLRDQWEKRAQSMADQCKQEAEWKQKSSLKVLFSKWTYHWSNGDQMKDEISDFRRVTSRTDEEDKKPKIKFKIVPPPPKLKAEPSPLPPPPPRRSSSTKPHRQKRKVEVDVFQLCWRESWMSLKPPKYLYLKAKEAKERRTWLMTTECPKSRKYTAKMCGWDTEWKGLINKWSHSWTQVKSPAQSEHSEDRDFQWDALFEKELVSKVEVGEYSLPVWAGTWKIMNFPFRQQKKNWDCGWENYQQDPSNKLDKFDLIQLQMDQDEPEGWVDSWKLSRAQFALEDITDEISSSSISDATFRISINDWLMPGWSKSYLLAAAPPEEYEERQKSWSSCWGYQQQIR
ncbi:hypothetical protein CHARACLAT_010839 [Characodon lateralis]|uniref:Uncharacterized protein n=1 Tax=Characodon lateralis TaxID=208331 RepID=A0ABU7DQ39_9TELE|nr:hypothetical protein [Characodon lateralis]